MKKDNRVVEATPAGVVDRADGDGTRGAERTRERRVVHPRCDIFETEQAVTLVADMPGVNERSLEVTLEQNLLKIAGRSEFAAPEGHALRWAEFEPVDYERSFALSGRVDADQITASIKNGVLRVSVPKAQPANKRIAVRAE